MAQQVEAHISTVSSTTASFHTTMTSPPLDNRATGSEMRIGLARLSARWSAARETSQWMERQAIVGQFSAYSLPAKDKLFINYAILDGVTTLLQEQRQR